MINPELSHISTKAHVKIVNLDAGQVGMGMSPDISVRYIYIYIYIPDTRYISNVFKVICMLYKEGNFCIPLYIFTYKYLMYRLNIFLTNLRGKCKYIRSMGHIITMAFCVCWYTTTFPGRLRPQFEESGVEGHNFDGGFMDANAILTNFHAHILLHPWVRDMCGTRAVQ